MWSWTHTHYLHLKKERRRLTVFIIRSVAAIIRWVEIIIRRIVSHHLLHMRVTAMSMIGSFWLVRRGTAVRYRGRGALIDHIRSACAWKITLACIRPIVIRCGGTVIVRRWINMLAIVMCWMKVWFIHPRRSIIDTGNGHWIEKIEVGYSHCWRMRIGGKMIAWFTCFDRFCFGGGIITGVFLKSTARSVERDRSKIPFLVAALTPRSRTLFPSAFGNDCSWFRSVSGPEDDWDWLNSGNFVVLFVDVPVDADAWMIPVWNDDGDVRMNHFQTYYANRDVASNTILSLDSQRMRSKQRRNGSRTNLVVYHLVLL